ncbi:helix-turn-helix domain-containing protein [Actinomadura sp. DC4]|uniref:helix-turn-helix domain-containing protein n=1 Tax=Actinomadura sp. DC4 TaxID=3055069 RepID=UPI0025AFD32F|nr:helix-turn-helix domain-containing protein [Actinomadura sp. DC4]MDN3359294.1 helix-turn-helix domain-containing protein [Actinomadura sp. DC4]
MPAQEIDDLLRPREVAEIFGVRTTTIARWAREGRLVPLLTPGGHRRYSRAGISDQLATQTDAGADPGRREMVEDAVRLYEQGWTIRQVARRFGCSYGVMRRLLGERTTLRSRGGIERRRSADEQHPRMLRPAQQAGAGIPDV